MPVSQNDENRGIEPKKSGRKHDISPGQREQVMWTGGTVGSEKTHSKPISSD